MEIKKYWTQISEVAKEKWARLNALDCNGCDSLIFKQGRERLIAQGIGWRLINPDSNTAETIVAQIFDTNLGIRLLRVDGPRFTTSIGTTHGVELEYRWCDKCVDSSNPSIEQTIADITREFNLVEKKLN